MNYELGVMNEELKIMIQERMFWGMHIYNALIEPS